MREMAGIVFGAIMPHGDYIPELGGPNSLLMSKTHDAATEIERLVNHARPDTVVIATPHGLIVDGYICVGATQIASGSLQGAKATIEMTLEIDIELAQLLSDMAGNSELPIANFVGEPGENTEQPLDWGVTIPLWYCGARDTFKKKCKFVIVAPSNSVHSDGLVTFGRALREAAERTGKRIAFIASCDWAHAHKSSGPYGYHPDAKRFDAIVQKIVAENRLADLAKIDPKLADNALADGIPQALILEGAIEDGGFQAHVHSYERPTYFGMLVASFTQ